MSIPVVGNVILSLLMFADLGPNRTHWRLKVSEPNLSPRAPPHSQSQWDDGGHEDGDNSSDGMSDGEVPNEDQADEDEAQDGSWSSILS